MPVRSSILRHLLSSFFICLYLVVLSVCSGELGLLQGSRLTAFELVHDKIPAVLVADSAAASLKSLGRVDAVVVGADRIAANGRCLNFHFLMELCCGGFVARSLLFSKLFCLLVNRGYEHIANLWSLNCDVETINC